MKEIIYKCDGCGEEKPMVYSTDEVGYCQECTDELEARGDAYADAVKEQGI